MKLSLVIPCYNEAESLPLLLERCKEIVINPGHEVILVDNGSTDRTAEVLRELLPAYPSCRSIRLEENRGYGFGILSGLKVADGDILGWTHADMQANPSDVLGGIEFFKIHGPNIFVKGRRYGRPIFDVAFTFGMSLFETLLLRKSLWDINAQPTMFSRNFFNSWNEPPHDFSLDLFAYYQARNVGMSVYRFPVNFTKRIHGVSHWNIGWSSKWKFICRTVGYSLQLNKRIKS